MNRREFLQRSALGTAVLSTTALESLGAEQPGKLLELSSKVHLTDVNVSLGQWPARRLPLDRTELLVKRLRALGIRQAWAGTFEGLLGRDLASANARLAAECKEHGRGMLLPIGTINPLLPGWQENLDRCSRAHGMQGIRVHPSFHGYTIASPLFREMLDRTETAGMFLQLSVALEDERVQHARMHAEATDLKPLPGLLKERRINLVLLNWSRWLRGALLSELGRSERVYFDIATLEGVAGISRLIQQLPVERVLFGSHAPFFYPESAVLKLRESELTAQQLRSIASENCRNLVPR